MADVFCIGCDTPFELNHQGLCESCAAELERDLIRSWAWDYSTSRAWASDEQREVLYKQVILDYGATYELLENPNKKKTKSKSKRSKSRATQRKREIATNAIREYTREDIFARIEVLLHNMTLNYWRKIFPDQKHYAVWSFSREYAKTPN